MLQYIVRSAKRLLVLSPGLAIAYVSVENIYPILDEQTPAVLAFLATYGLGAYVLVPALTRFTRLFYQPRHLPVYSVTPDGFASDPVNVGIIGTKRELISAMHRAGWEVADDHTIRNIIKEVFTIIFRIPYPTTPMSTLYLFGRHQDIGFEIQIEDRRGYRHHVRFWATTYDKDVPLTSSDNIHWFPRKALKQHEGERLLWLGAASKDVGLALIRHNAQFTHMIHPNTNAERDLIVDQLQIDGAKLKASIRIMNAYTLVNRAWRGYLDTDGVLKVVALPDSRLNRQKTSPARLTRPRHQSNPVQKRKAGNHHKKKA